MLSHTLSHKACDRGLYCRSALNSLEIKGLNTHIDPITGIASAIKVDLSSIKRELLGHRVAKEDFSR